MSLLTFACSCPLCLLLDTGRLGLRGLGSLGDEGVVKFVVEERGEFPLAKDVMPPCFAVGGVTLSPLAICSRLSRRVV